MTAELIVIVPTRSRPHNVGPVVKAWQDTDAFRHGAELHFVIDGDDPEYDAYDAVLSEVRDMASYNDRSITWAVHGTWQPLVPKLNSAAAELLLWAPYALGFAGDDHLPRTKGWVRRYLSALREPGAAIVHGNDGYQGGNLPTEWAVRADVVRAVGMVPAPVEHLYCDNAVRDLGNATYSLRYLDDVSIEHMHPVAGKADDDEQYQRVNGRQQYRGDRRAYREWRDMGGLDTAASLVRAVLD